MSTPTPPYTKEQLDGDDVSKKDLVTYLQATSSLQFMLDHKLKGQLKNVAKTKTKDALIADYNAMFETKAFREEGDAQAEADHMAKKVDSVIDKTKKLEVTEVADAGPPKFTKKLLKKGNKLEYPKKGDKASCYYTGKTADGKVFDTNAQLAKKGNKKFPPLMFKVGVGAVIKGWDEAIQTMSIGEIAEVVIEPAWAYGKKGLEGTIPPNSTLTFEIELVTID